MSTKDACRLKALFRRLEEFCLKLSKIKQILIVTSHLKHLGFYRFF